MLASLLLIGCTKYQEPLRLEGNTMGTTYRVLIRMDGLDIQVEEASLHQKIDDKLILINKLMSTYDPNSEISRFNAAPQDTPFQLTGPTASVLAAALALAQKTSGAFDPTISPLVELWGFGPSSRGGGLPSTKAIKEARDRVGYQALMFEPATGLLSSEERRRLDFSAIAKGYAVDSIAEMLLGEGFEHYLVEIGGELRGSGLKSEGVPWRVAIETPDSASRTVFKTLALRDRAIATSGDYRNFFEFDGQRYSHTIDPATGYPVDHKTVSVSVIADTSMMADSWATALNVIGPERGIPLANREGLAVMMIAAKSTEPGWETFESTAMRAYLEESR